MLDLVLDALSWIFVVAGGFFMLVGGIGVIRMPDFFTRQHAAGITDTMGANLMLIGLMFQLDPGLNTVKLGFVVAFIFLTSPTSSHALAQAAITTGMRPLGTDLRGAKPGAGKTAPASPMPSPDKEGAPSNR